MSDWSIDFQPAIEEPSNMKPSSKKSSSTRSATRVTCCSLPLGSVKRTSTYSTSSVFIRSRTSLTVIGILPPSVCPAPPRGKGHRILCAGRAGSDRVVAGLAGADADGLFDRDDEDLAVADLLGA